MSDELKELISSADKGSTAAQRELMQRGDAASAAGDHQQAAYLYKMAAMAYRIEATRTDGKLTDATHNYVRELMKVRYYDEWVKAYTAPKAPRILELSEKKLASEASSFILRLRRDKHFGGRVSYLERVLAEKGVYFCAPGGTINRHFHAMINQREDFIAFMHDIDIRVVLDPICDEVLRMCAESQSKSNDNQ